MPEDILNNVCGKCLLPIEVVTDVSGQVAEREQLEGECKMLRECLVSRDARITELEKKLNEANDRFAEQLDAQETALTHDINERLKSERERGRRESAEHAANRLRVVSVLLNELCNRRDLPVELLKDVIVARTYINSALKEDHDETIRPAKVKSP